MRLAYGILFLLTLCLGHSTMAQVYTPETIARMLVEELSPTRSMEGGEWFTNRDNLGRETRALGIIYVHVPGSAGTVSLHAGIFELYDSGWVKIRDVSGLYGVSPRNAVFQSNRIELETTTLAPGDARCCPTQKVRWHVDVNTGAAIPLK